MKKRLPAKSISKIKKHLKEDIHGYKKEIKEDEDLLQTIKPKTTRKKMAKKQGYDARLDESMGMRNPGKKKQSMASRRKESEGMEKSAGKKKYAAVRSMGKKK